jgi:hypothetical protein
MVHLACPLFQYSLGLPLILELNAFQPLENLLGHLKSPLRMGLIPTFRQHTQVQRIIFDNKRLCTDLQQPNNPNKKNGTYYLALPPVRDPNGAR